MLNPASSAARKRWVKRRQVQELLMTLPRIGRRLFLLFLLAFVLVVSGVLQQGNVGTARTQYVDTQEDQVCKSTAQHACSLVTSAHLLFVCLDSANTQTMGLVTTVGQAANRRCASSEAIALIVFQIPVTLKCCTQTSINFTVCVSLVTSIQRSLQVQM